MTTVLQQRHVQTSYVGWTWWVEWYGRLGYYVWHAYMMAWQQL